MSPASAPVAAGPRAWLNRDAVATALPGAVVVGVLLLGGLLLTPYGQFLGQSALVMATIALGLGVVTGRMGVVSLCQMSFAGLGAWVIFWLNLHAPGIPFVLAVPLSGLAMVPVSLLVSLPALRIRGINLAVITLAFAVTVDIVLVANEFPGLSQGVTLLRPAFLADDGSYLWFCAVVFVLLALLLAGLDRTRLGASWKAARHSERGTAALGRSVPLSKVTAFALSAFIAGVGGAMLAGQLGTVTVVSFGPLTSLVIFAVAVMVSARHPEGALLAGVLTVWLPEILQQLSIPLDYGNMIFGVGAILSLLGGAGAAEGIRRKLRSLSGGDAVSDATPTGIASRVVKRAPAGAPALAVTNLTVAYGQLKALDRVSLTISPDQVVALVGPNGAGKSTLIDAVTGFVPRYEGSVEIGGIAVDGLPPRQRARAGVRRSFQQDRTTPDLSVGQYVRLGFEGTAHVAHDELEDLLAHFHCPRAHTMIADVDVGRRRLIEVVAAIAPRPATVLLDEPAAGLPSAESARLASCIAEVPSRFGVSVLLVEHDMELVTGAADEVVVLDFGHVIATGTPEAALSDENVVRAYLGEEVAV